MFAVRIALFSFLLVLGAVLSLPAQASANVPEAFQGSSLGCRAFGAAVGIASVHPLARSASAVNKSIAKGVSAVIGEGITAPKCDDAVDRLIEHYRAWDLNYDEYIESQCGGDPSACSDPLLNPMNHFGTPAVCSTFIVCVSPYLSADGSASVEDLMGGVNTIGFGVNLGFWVMDPVSPSPDPEFDRQ